MNLDTPSSLLSLQLSVQEVVSRWPQAVLVFTKFRMSCPGCCLEAFDSLGDALLSYSVPADDFMRELDTVVRQTHSR